MYQSSHTHRDSYMQDVRLRNEIEETNPGERRVFGSKMVRTEEDRLSISFSFSSTDVANKDAGLHVS